MAEVYHLGRIQDFADTPDAIAGASGHRRVSRRDFERARSHASSASRPPASSSSNTYSTTRFCEFAEIGIPD
jgi:hypothetical protein